MKIIISRKGVDSVNGEFASPVMPDGSMISYPIPSMDEDTYADLFYDSRSYLDIAKELNPKKNIEAIGCHLDPDLRRDCKEGRRDDWRPILGQCDEAESHLENKGVEVGDIFLFFGVFRQTEEIDGVLKYKKGTKDAHMLYGYLQIGRIIWGEDMNDYPWHVHNNYYNWNNTMYVASDRLVIDGVDTGLPGAGVFRYSDELVLTKPGETKSRWLLPDFFKEVEISCHSKDCFKPEGYFQSVRIGQEFVVSEDPRVTEWAKGIIERNAVKEFYAADTKKGNSTGERGQNQFEMADDAIDYDAIDDIVNGVLDEMEQATNEAEELDEKEIPEVTKIFFDMDGVLADFEMGVRDLCGFNPPNQNEEVDPNVDEQMWAAIRGVEHFYDKLELMPDAKELFDAVYKKYGDRCEILTGIPKEKRGITTAAEDKIKWVRRLLSEDIKVNIVYKEDKPKFCTGKGCILIDDRKQNIMDWKKMGGSGFLNVEAWHTIDRLVGLGVIDEPDWENN